VISSVFLLNYFLFGDQMSEAPSMWVGPVLGGVALATVSSVGNYVVEKESPKVKAVARDFILGSILMLLIMHILPESTNRLIGGILAIASVKKGVDSMAGGAEEVPSNPVAALMGNLLTGPSVETVTAPASGSIEDYEIRVGVPRF